MKQLIISALLLSSMVICSQSCIRKVTGTPFTNATMKPWFDKYCYDCHESSGNNWLYDPSNYESSIKQNINALYSSIYIRQSMPRGMMLSTAELKKFKDWYDAGYPAN